MDRLPPSTVRVHPGTLARAMLDTPQPAFDDRGPSRRSSRRCFRTAPARRIRPAFSAPTTRSRRSPGSLGALIALLGTSAEWLLIYPVAAAAGLLASSRLSAVVELGHELEEDPLPPLHRSRGIVMRLSGLFALDSFGGGFVPQTFIAYLFTRRPVAPLLAGPAATLALGAPFVIAGALKSVYDLGLYRLPPHPDRRELVLFDVVEVDRR